MLNKPEMIRPAWRDLSVFAKRAHLMADHRFMPSEIGGDDTDDSAWILDNTDVLALTSEHDTEHAELIYEDLPAGTTRVGHEHLPRRMVLTQQKAPWPLLSITFSNDAWEYMHGMLVDLVERNIAVHLNGNPTPIELQQIIGNPFDGDLTRIVLIGRRWSLETEAYDDAVTIPLFHEDGNCVIWQVSVL